MDIRSETALNEMALLKPRQSLQNIGEKKDDEKREDGGFQAFGPDGFTFLDFLDVINPLQHIPLISTLYRDLTGDSIDPGSRIAGGTLFGGPIGAAAATANVMLTHSTGKDMGDHIMALLNGDEAPADAAVELAGAAQEKETASGAAGGPVEMAALAPLSPVTANLEVLEWARREAALNAGTAPATAQSPTLRPIDDLRAQTVENKGIPGASTEPVKSAKPTNSYDIAGNAEVLDWARSETRRANTPWLVQERDVQQQAQNQGRDGLSSVDTARQKAVASGLTHEQLNGAAAPSGGWFSETMLLALASYQDGAGLGKAGGARSQIGATDQNMSE